MLQSPIYAGAYAFGRSGHRTRIVDGRAIKSAGHSRAREQWSVLLPDHHPGYITWEQFERNQVIMSENAHRVKKAQRKSGRGGRALLTGILRCGRCARMLRVNYGTPAQRPHRYFCGGSSANSKKSSCLAVGGVRVDSAVADQLVEALAPHAIDAALEAARRATSSQEQVHAAIERDLAAAKYEAELDARRHRAVDPDKRHVARELESRWEASLERVRTIEQRLTDARAEAHATPAPDRETLLCLARDLVSTWNAPGIEMRTKQRLVHILIREVVVDRDDTTNENVVTIHWQGGVHTELRLARGRRGGYSDGHSPNALDVVRTLGGKWPDPTVAGTLNRMRCPNAEQRSWTAAQVRELRERLEIADFDPAAPRPASVSLDEAARRLGIIRDSVRRLIREGVMPGKQLAPFAPWEIPADALDSEEVRAGVQRVKSRRPLNSAALEDRKNHRLPGI